MATDFQPDDSVDALAVTVRKPRTRYTIGRTAALLIFLKRILPDRVMDRMTSSDLGKHYPSK